MHESQETGLKNQTPKCSKKCIVFAKSSFESIWSYLFLTSITRRNIFYKSSKITKLREQNFYTSMVYIVEYNSIQKDISILKAKRRRPKKRAHMKTQLTN